MNLIKKLFGSVCCAENFIWHLKSNRWHLVKSLFLAASLLAVLSCKENKSYTADEIVNNAIDVSGGHLYDMSTISFKFRDKEYVSKNRGAVLERSFYSDSLNYVDVKSNTDFQRFINDTPVTVSDSLAQLYSNSINSVHYFAQLPYHLNDKSVNRTLLGDKEIMGKNYYVVKITFDQKGGGVDFEDTYYYWFNKETFKPDYLAYDFHTDGGGVRFRKAYNERYVNGIRFVDYENFKPKNDSESIDTIADLFINGQLILLSKIELENIKVDTLDD